MSRDGWKLVRYFSDVEALEEGDEYELYDLETDPNEQYNLLVFHGEFPTVVDPIPEGQSLDAGQIAAKAREMKALLMGLEKRMLERPERAGST